MQRITTLLFPLNLFCLVLSFQHMLQHKEERSSLRTLPWFGQPTSFNTNLAYGKASRVSHCERIGPWRSIEGSKLSDLAMTTNHTQQIAARHQATTRKLSFCLHPFLPKLLPTVGRPRFHRPWSLDHLSPLFKKTKILNKILQVAWAGEEPWSLSFVNSWETHHCPPGEETGSQGSEYHPRVGS